MKKLVKVLMMMTLVLGVASCNDQDDAPTLPNNPADNQEEVEEPTGGQTEYFDIVQRLKDSASEYDNITIIDKTTDKSYEMMGNGKIFFECSSFKGFPTIITFDDYRIVYEIIIPAEGAKLNLKVDYDHYIGLSDIMYLNKDRIEIPFNKDLLGLRGDEELYKTNIEIGEIEYFHKTYNDYLIGVYESPQVLQLEILPNQSGEEQILCFGVSDYLPFLSGVINIIQAAK